MKLYEIALDSRDNNHSEDGPEHGVYMAAKYDDDTLSVIVDMMERHHIPNPLSSRDIHTTIVYSRVPVPGLQATENIDPPEQATHIGYEVWPSQKDSNCLVMLLDSTFLHSRFAHAVDDLGATYDYDEYKPHITLSYDVPKDFDPSSLPTITTPLNIISEYTEELSTGD